MSQEGKPWHTISTGRIWKSKWYNLRQDQVRLHTGEEITYTYQEHPGAVFVVPVTVEGNVVLIRQYRYPIRKWLWEVPAGAVDEGEAIEDAARRELYEEIGGKAATLHHIGHFYSASSVSDLRADVFLATDVRLEPNQREQTELIEIGLLPTAEALAMARQGKIGDGQSALALLLCESSLHLPPPSPKRR